MKRNLIILAAGAATLLLGACGVSTQPMVSNASTDSTTTTSWAPTSTTAGASQESSYEQFDNRAECMAASWTTFSRCDSEFPVATSSGGYDSSYGYGSSSGSASSPSYGSSLDSTDYGDAGCRLLNDLGSTGDYQTDQMSRAIRDNYCSSSGMRSNPDYCGALRDMPASGDPETDRLSRSVLNNFC